MKDKSWPEGFADALKFPLFDALMGRRSRRFGLGMTIEGGPFAHQSSKPPEPLSELERTLLLTSMTANTGWHNLIPFNLHYSPYLPNYAGAAGGRTFPSGAGFHTCQLFYTDDDGVYFLGTRDLPALMDKRPETPDDAAELAGIMKTHIRKLSDRRLDLPSETPHTEGHNLWVANKPGTTLIFPVVDLSLHFLLNLCYFVQNKVFIYDDLNGVPIEGLKRFSHMGDPDNAMPLSLFEQIALSEAMVEIATSCYAGALMLQAAGLGGWMFNGLNWFTILGAEADKGIKGLGFHFESDDRWPVPNPTGLPGVMEGFCPPHYPTIADAVQAVVQRKFGSGGPFNPETPGFFQDTPSVRGSAQVHDDEFKACVTVMADYVYQTFGKLPATTPSIWLMMFLQACHLDLEFYDRFYQPGAYLPTHADHMKKWHGK